MWYDCARHVGDVELTVKLLLELLIPGTIVLLHLSCHSLLNEAIGIAVTKEERATFEGDLEGILKVSPHEWERAGRPD